MRETHKYVLRPPEIKAFVAQTGCFPTRRPMPPLPTRRATYALSPAPLPSYDHGHEVEAKYKTR
jgi:hypothetical protein